MNKYKTLAANTALMSVGTFGSKLLVFLMVRFYTEYLTPADYGTADLLTQTANLLIPMISLGVTDGVFRFAIEKKGAHAAVFTAGLGVVTAGCLLFALLLPFLNGIPDIGGYVWSLGAFVAASCYHALCAQFIRATGNTRLFAIQGLINTALMIGLNIFFLAVLRFGVMGYVLSFALANFLCTVFLVLKERLWRYFTPCLSNELLREMLRYSIPLIPTAVFWWITSVSDRYMISAFLGAEANGLYTVACRIPTILTILSAVFMDAWQLSAVTESNGERNAHLHFYAKVWSVFCALMVICGAGIIAFSQIEIRLLSTEGYYTAWSCIPLLSIAMIFASFSTFMGSVYVVTKKSMLSFWTAMVGAVLNIALNLILIPSPLGIQGAAVATLLSYLVIFLIRTVSARRLIPFPLNLKALTAGTLVLTIQTTCILLQLPLWQPIQAVAILLLVLLNYKPLLVGAKKLGLPKAFGHH